MKSLAIALCLAAASFPAVAKDAFTGPELGGTYRCTGVDDHEGPYTGTVTLERVPSQSRGPNGAYRFSLEVPGYGTYPGHAAAIGTDMAIHFALVDPTTKDYGTGLARFTRDKAGRWSFHKFYFEPEFKGGNHGIEDCVQQSSSTSRRSA